MLQFADGGRMSPKPYIAWDRYLAGRSKAGSNRGDDPARLSETGRTEIRRRARLRLRAR